MGSPESFSPDPSREEAISDFMAGCKREVDWIKRSKAVREEDIIEREEDMRTFIEDLSADFHEFRDRKSDTNSQGDTQH